MVQSEASRRLKAADEVVGELCEVIEKGHVLLRDMSLAPELMVEILAAMVVMEQVRLYEELTCPAERERLVNKGTEMGERVHYVLTNDRPDQAADRVVRGAASHPSGGVRH